MRPEYWPTPDASPSTSRVTGVKELELIATLKQNQVRLEYLRLRKDALHELYGRHATPEYDWRKAETHYQEMQIRIEEDRKTLAQLQADLRNAQQRLAEYTRQTPGSPALDKLLEPFRAAITVQERKMSELSLERSMLVLRSPMDGVISQVLRRTGEAVIAGEPVFTVTASRPMDVVVYVTAAQASRFHPGVQVEVELAGRSDARMKARSQVTGVGPAAEQLPPRLWQNPTIPEWGWPVSISVSPELGVLSGGISRSTRVVAHPGGWGDWEGRKGEHMPETTGPLPNSATRLAPNGPRQDPLSEAIERLAMRAWIPRPLDLSAPWGILVGNRAGWFYLIRSGACLIELEGNSNPVSLTAGDLAIVTQGHTHTLRDGPGSPTTRIEELLAQGHFAKQDRAIHGGRGMLTSISCGCFMVEDAGQNPLNGALPPMIQVKGQWGQPQPYVDYILRLSAQEAASPEPCSQLINNRLVRILLTKAIHAHLSKSDNGGGWLRALRDPDIGQALGVMHAHPENSWTVASLAEQVAMSRSVFSARFAAMVGKPPLEYLSQLRMQKAGFLLRTTKAELKEVASQVGYESAAAFSKAFSRWSGTSPGNYRRLGQVPMNCRIPGLPPQ